MTKASDNVFPSMLYAEGTTPSSPSAGQQRLFVRSSDHVLCMVNSSGTVVALSGSLTNPMTTAGDIIYGGASGVPTRLAAVAVGKLLGSAGTGTAPAYVAATTLRLNYSLGSDITALAVGNASWSDVIANENFTVGSATSLIEFAPRGFAFNGGASGNISLRLNVNSGGTPVLLPLGAMYQPITGQSYGNILAGSGSVFVSGLPTGTNTVKFQAYGSTSGLVLYARASTGYPPEHLELQVIEHL